MKGNTRCEFYPLSLLFIFWYMLIIITAFQDGGSYHRPNKNNSDHLVIDSWTDEDNEKAQATQQHMGKYLYELQIFSLSPYLNKLGPYRA